MSLAALTSPLSALSHDRRAQGFLCALVGAVAFSGKAIVAKLMYRHGADAFSVVGLRMGLALPMFLLMAWWAGRSVESAVNAAWIAAASGCAPAGGAMVTCSGSYFRTMPFTASNIAACRIA